MTDDTQHDDTVSAGYRELATERTPASLDQQVLRMATNRVEHADYARSIRWTRPLAFAATVAICLAITLQLTRVPAPEEVVSSPQFPEPPAADRPLADMPAAEQSLAKQVLPAAVTSTEKVESAAGTASSLHEEVDFATPARRARDDGVAAPVAGFELKSKDSDALQRAEEMARLQNATNAEQRATAPICPEEVRARPESWLKCIAELEEIGDLEAAALERKSLVAVFPEFKLP